MYTAQNEVCFRISSKSFHGLHDFHEKELLHLTSKTTYLCLIRKLCALNCVSRNCLLCIDAIPSFTRLFNCAHILCLENVI